MTTGRRHETGRSRAAARQGARHRRCQLSRVPNECRLFHRAGLLDGALPLPQSLEEDDARRDADVEAVRGRGHRDRDELVRRPPASNAETPWRSLPTTTATGPSRRASQQRRSASGVATTTRTPLRPQPREPRHRYRALPRPGGGRACRPSRERHRGGRRRCARRRRAARSRPTSRRSGRACPGCPAARSPRRRGAAGRRQPSAEATSATAGRPRAARRAGCAEIERNASAPSSTTRAPRLRERRARRRGAEEELGRGVDLLDRRVASRARRTWRWPSTRNTDGLRRRASRRTALSRSLALLVMWVRRVTAPARGVGMRSRTSLGRATSRRVRAHAPTAAVGRRPGGARDGCATWTRGPSVRSSPAADQCG